MTPAASADLQNSAATGSLMLPAKVRENLLKLVDGIQETASLSLAERAEAVVRAVKNVDDGANWLLVQSGAYGPLEKMWRSRVVDAMGHMGQIAHKADKVREWSHEDGGPTLLGVEGLQFRAGAEYSLPLVRFRHSMKLLGNRMLSNAEASLLHRVHSRLRGAAYYLRPSVAYEVQASRDGDVAVTERVGGNLWHFQMGFDHGSGRINRIRTRNGLDLPFLKVLRIGDSGNPQANGKTGLEFRTDQVLLTNWLEIKIGNKCVFSTRFLKKMWLGMANWGTLDEPSGQVNKSLLKASYQRFLGRLVRAREFLGGGAARARATAARVAGSAANTARGLAQSAMPAGPGHAAFAGAR